MGEPDASKVQGQNKNIGILLVNRTRFVLSDFANNTATQWKWLACLQALLSVWAVQSTQQVPSVTLLAVVVWGGAAICFEDHLEELEVRPTRPSLVVGCLFLAYTAWRSATILDLDSGIYVLPFLQGLGLACLARPLRHLGLFRDALIALSLFMIQPLFINSLPEYTLSVLTGRLSQALLLVFGINASASGRIVDVGGGGVEILGECNSVDLIGQLTAIAVVFVLAFPVRGVLTKISYVGLAPLMAMLINSCRISILAVIAGSSWVGREKIFDFLHEEWGSLVFAGIATAIMGQIYLFIVDRYLERARG